MNPNHYLAVAIDYLYPPPGLAASVAVGKTAVSSVDHRPGGGRPGPAGGGAGRLQVVRRRIDRRHNRLRRRGVGRGVVPAPTTGRWTTDKDGIIMAAGWLEMIAVTGLAPGALYEELAGRVRRARLRPVDAPAAESRRCWARCRPSRSPPPSWRRTDHRELTTARATARPSAA